MSEINITNEDRQILEDNVTNISMEFKMSVNYNTIGYSMSIDVHPDVGFDKSYKWLRSQIYYHRQQLFKDIENKLELTEGGNIPNHAL